MTKTIAILQSNYIPWKGTFDLIRSVDEFIILDSVQFTKNDWRNRNRIKTPAGPAWLTIPIKTAGKFGQCIAEAEVADPAWAQRHWRTIVQSYGRAPFFRHYAPQLEQAYIDAGRESRLGRINRLFLDLMCGWLEIETPIRSSDYYLHETGRVDRLISLCRGAGASGYVTGPSARCYLDISRFEAAGIEVVFFDYSGYPEYAQLHPPFLHEVSALDLILTAGPLAARLIPRAGIHLAHQ